MTGDAALDRIFMISERMIIFDGLDDVFEHIIKTAIALTNAEAATIRVFDIENGSLNIVKGFGVTEGFLSQPPIKIGEGITGQVVMTGQPYSTTNVLADVSCKNAEMARMEGIQSVICVPMKNREGAMGCITVYRKTGDAFSDHELLLLSIFSSEAVQAVEKARMLNELKKQATLDSLTGLYNKRAFTEKLAIEIDRSQRHQHSVSLLFIDLDGFKTYNDIHGHLMGDKLLHDFTRILKQSCRRIDILGRFGGDEFVIIAPQTNTSGAMHLAEKIRSTTQEAKFMQSTVESICRITCSIGVNIIDGWHPISPEEALEQTDQALYQSKKTGKNRFTVFQQPAQKNCATEND